MERKDTHIMKKTVNFVKEDTAIELAEALAIVDPQARLESDEDGTYTVITDGVPASVNVRWKSKQIHSGGDLYKLADTIKFANPAAECTVSRYHVHLGTRDAPPDRAITMIITPSPTDTRIILYRLGTDPVEYLLKTVNENYEGIILLNGDTKVFGSSRPFEYGVTTDEELSAWLTGVLKRQMKVVTDHDLSLHFTLNGKRGYANVITHTRAFADFIEGGMYTLFEIDGTQPFPPMAV